MKKEYFRVVVIQRDQNKKNPHNMPDVYLARYCCLNLLFRNYMCLLAAVLIKNTVKDFYL